MGYANQQGGTCTVAALADAVRARRFARLIALGECALWAFAMGLLLMALGWRGGGARTHAVDAAVLAGGVLLGLGAWLNDACIFGTVARIGRREWAYLLTPAGYFLGTLALVRIAGLAPRALAATMGRSAAATPPILLVLCAASLTASLVAMVAVRRRGAPFGALWDYRHATIAIGLSCVAITVLAGPWTYTDAIAAAARGGMATHAGSLTLFLAVLAGAWIGGRNGPAAAPPRLSRGLRCLVGGALMGTGAALLPGGSDSLLLQGVPALQPYAWTGLATVMLTIVACLILSQRTPHAKAP